MKSPIISHISLTSSDRSNSSDSVSNFSYRLPNPIRDCIGVAIDCINFPVTYYTVMTGINDTIVIDVSSTDYTATLDPGIYTIAELVTEAQTQIRAAYTVDNLHAVALDATTQKITISHSSTSFSIEWSTTGSAYKLMGFNNSDTSAATSHVAPNIFNLTHGNFVHIISNKLTPQNNIIGNNWRNTLFILPLDQDFGTFKTYINQGQNFAYTYSSPLNLYEIDLKLEFEDGNEIPLNGVDWSISIRMLRSGKN